MSTSWEAAEKKYNKLTKGTTRPDKQVHIKRRVEIACKRLSWRALEVLEEAMDDPEADHGTKIKAAQEILNRAWGRPRVKVEAEVTHAPSEDFMKLMNKAQARVIEGQVIEEKLQHEKTMMLEDASNIQDAIEVLVESEEESDASARERDDA